MKSKKSKTPEKIKCVCCGRRREVRDVRRLINLIVMRDQDLNIKEKFTSAVASALREYADGLDLGVWDEKKFGKAVEEFTATNGCIVRIIAGRYDHEVKKEEGKRTRLWGIDIWNKKQ